MVTLSLHTCSRTLALRFRSKVPLIMAKNEKNGSRTFSYYAIATVAKVYSPVPTILLAAAFSFYFNKDPYFRIW